MAGQARRIPEMSIDELRKLIADEIKSELERYDILDADDQVPSSKLAMAQRYIEDHRITLPPGSPSVAELVRRERDQWQP